jgi:hypothetical protein
MPAIVSIPGSTSATGDVVSMRFQSDLTDLAGNVVEFSVSFSRAEVLAYVQEYSKTVSQAIDEIILGKIQPQYEKTAKFLAECKAISLTGTKQYTW